MCWSSSPGQATTWIGSEVISCTIAGELVTSVSSFGGCSARRCASASALEDASRKTVEPFATGGDAPRYLGPDVELEASGLVFTDTGRTVTYVPGLARLDDSVIARLAASDLVLVDGTFWHDDDLARLGLSDRTARDMGHTPLAGPDGSLSVLAALERPRKVLVHINNTNPILLDDSPEREQVVRAGVEVAYDGLEVEL